MPALPSALPDRGQLVRLRTRHWLVDKRHLLVSGSATERQTEIQCATCRSNSAIRPEVSAPTVFVSRPLVARLYQLKSVAVKSPNTLKLEELFRAECDSKWTELRRRQESFQMSLFAGENSGELGHR